ncbi:MAG: hypothetical protein M3Q00_01310 [Pseudomonadota bacterium]|nr:hypothetical protein [Pseudomonadota bacterium]
MKLKRTFPELLATLPKLTTSALASAEPPTESQRIELELKALNDQASKIEREITIRVRRLGAIRRAAEMGPGGSWPCIFEDERQRYERERAK